jgi:hypothetical protein
VEYQVEMANGREVAREGEYFYAFGGESAVKPFV